MRAYPPGTAPRWTALKRLQQCAARKARVGLNPADQQPIKWLSRPFWPGASRAGHKIR